MSTRNFNIGPFMTGKKCLSCDAYKNNVLVFLIYSGQFPFEPLQCFYTAGCRSFSNPHSASVDLCKLSTGQFHISNQSDACFWVVGVNWGTYTKPTKTFRRTCKLFAQKAKNRTRDSLPRYLLFYPRLLLTVYSSLKSPTLQWWHLNQQPSDD